MKKIFTIVAFAIFTLNLNAQTRYLDEVFDEVTITQDVAYGMNATVLYVSVFGEAVPEVLNMDIYEPTGDTETARPFMIYAHTGNFLPTPTNGSPSGTKRDSIAVEICTRYAKMGYVVASIDYRLGWNPLADTQDERINLLINAVYRAVQDARTAVRFFRVTEAELGNPYHIDPDKAVMWGQGSGGYIALAAATLNDPEELLLPKFIGENLFPMVNVSINGDLYGTSVGIHPITGDTLCYENHVGYSSDYNAYVNTGGALADISWLEDGDAPIISFQSPTDPFAPYTTGTVIVPVVNLPVVEVHGSYLVQQAQNTFGNNASFPESSLSDPFTAQADANNDGFFGLFPILTDSPLNSSPWDWWAADNPNNENGLATNPNMSAEIGRTYADTLQGYSAPRLACALGLSVGLDCPVVSVDEISLFEYNVYPNPTTDNITISSEENIEAISVFNLLGELVVRQENINTNSTIVNLSAMENGVYMVTITVDGLSSSKYVVKK